jgi:hypothetical protein
VTDHPRDPCVNPARFDVLDGEHNFREVRNVTTGANPRVTYVGKAGVPTTITLTAWRRWAATATVRTVGGDR